MAYLLRALVTRGHRINRDDLDDLYLWEIGIMLGADQHTTTNLDDPAIIGILGDLDFAPPSPDRKG